MKEDAMPLASEMEEGARSRWMYVPLGPGRAKEVGSPPGSPGSTQPCRLWPPDLEESKLVLC